MIKYVAPVENPDGIAAVTLNTAVQVHSVSGTCSFVLQKEDSMYSMCLTLEKESSALLSVFKNDEAKWKKRKMMIAGGFLHYAKDMGNFGEEPKHKLHLKKVVGIEVTNSHHHKDLIKHVNITYIEDKNATKESKWKLRFTDETHPKYRREFVRKLYRSCPQITEFLKY